MGAVRVQDPDGLADDSQRLDSATTPSTLYIAPQVGTFFTFKRPEEEKARIFAVFNRSAFPAFAVDIILPWLEAEAKENQRLAGKVAGNLYGFGRGKTDENTMLVQFAQAWDKSRKEASKLLGVGVIYISYAKGLGRTCNQTFRNLRNVGMNHEKKPLRKEVARKWQSLPVRREPG